MTYKSHHVIDGECICGPATTAQCPGRPMTPDEQDQVQAGIIDYREGRWFVNLRPGMLGYTLSQLEPAVTASFGDMTDPSAKLDLNNLNLNVALSSAISQRRIADALTEPA